MIRNQVVAIRLPNAVEALLIGVIGLYEAIIDVFAIDGRLDLVGLDDLAKWQYLISRIIICLPFWEPPTMIGLNGSCFDDWRNGGFEFRTTVFVPYLHPLAMGYTFGFCILGVYLDNRIGMQFSQNGNLSML